MTTDSQALGIPLHLDDKARHLRFDLAAVRDLEASLGGQPLGVIWQQLGQMGITAMCVALYIGLKHEDRTLSQNLVNKMIERYISDGGKLKPIVTALTEAFEASGIFQSLDEELGNVAAEPATAEDR